MVGPVLSKTHKSRICEQWWGNTENILTSSPVLPLSLLNSGKITTLFLELYFTLAESKIILAVASALFIFNIDVCQI